MEEKKSEVITMKILVRKNPKYDHETIIFSNKKGHGFVGKEDGKFGLVRCPACGMENYAMNVMSGRCTWCPFDMNKIKFKLINVKKQQDERKTTN